MAGGFLLLPTSVLTPDPAAVASWGTADPNSLDLSGSPPLHGVGGPSYDLAVQRWLPSRWNLISTDGRAYAYADTDHQAPGPTTPFRIHVVDARSGADRVVHAGDRLLPIEFNGDGIYAVGSRWEASSLGLYRIDPATGAIRTIRETGDWSVIGAGVAWGSDGPTRGLGDHTSRIDALDLTSGVVRNWLPETADLSRWVTAVDSAGAAVVMTRTSPNTGQGKVIVSLMSAPGVVRTIYEPPAPTSVDQIFPDGPALWIRTSGALLRFEQGSGVKVAFSGRLQAIAGTCRP